MSTPTAAPPAPLRACGAFLLAGPTGVGKSEVAVAFAEAVGGEIIGADAFQVYAGLPILTAQPEPALRTRVPHHLVGEVPLTESWDVAQYLRAATAQLQAVHARGHVPIIVGGTGLYFRALQHGLAELPTADEALRAELSARSLAALQAELQRLDPAGAATIDLQNPRRVVRALEVCLLTGQPYSAQRTGWEREGTPLVPLGVVLTREREALYARIEARTAAMWQAGVVREVQALGELGPTAAQTLGLAEIRRCLMGEWSAAEAQAAIAQATRRYAKRQLTWFRKEPALVPVNMEAYASGPALVNALCDIWRKAR